MAGPDAPSLVHAGRLYQIPYFTGLLVPSKQTCTKPPPWPRREAVAWGVLRVLSAILPIPGSPAEQQLKTAVPGTSMMAAKGV